MLLETVRKFLEGHALLAADLRLAVAYSGGPDSTCLLSILREIHADTSALYVNHQLRAEESDNEEEFVTKFCGDRNIPLVIERISWSRRPSNLEEAARKRRYRHFATAAEKHGVRAILLAHHRDDVVENFLLRLLRGAGTAGLAGMSAHRGIFFRPMLFCSRAEITGYLNEKQIPFFLDSSNQDVSFVRNRVRKELIPLLEQNYNPNIRAAIARTSNWIAEHNRVLRELLAPMKSVIHEENGVWKIAKSDLLALSHPVKKAVLRMALEQADPSMRPGTGVLERVLRCCETEEILELPGFLVVKSTPESILFHPKTQSIGLFEIDVPKVGSYNFPPGNARLTFSVENAGGIQPVPNVAYLDAARASFPFSVRNWKKGDRFQPLGMTGKKKLSDYWIDRKVSRQDRKRIPLIFKDDNLVWVAGHQLDHRYRVTDETKTVLKIEHTKLHE